MKINKLPSLEFLKECFVLDFSLPNGIRWASDRPLSHFYNERAYKSWKTKHSNKSCGFISKAGYFITSISKKEYQNHRIIFAIYHNTLEFNDKCIDHIDGNPLNNSYNNLRIANHSQNSFNSKIRKDNSSGYKNIQIRRYKETQRFIVRLKINGKDIKIGSYKTLEQAIEARNLKLKQIIGEFYKS